MTNKNWNLPPKRTLREMNDGERAVYRATIQSINNGAYDVAGLYSKVGCGTCMNSTLFSLGYLPSRLKEKSPEQLQRRRMFVSALKNDLNGK